MENALCEALNKIQDRDLLIYPDPDILDFNSNKPVQLCIRSKDVFLQIPLGEDLKQLQEYLGAAQFFCGGDKSILLTWNLKNLLTYIRGRTGVDYHLKGKIFDLSFLESYAGEEKDRPATFSEGMQRLLKLTKNSGWSKVNTVYQQVYLPLILSIPKIETYGLSHKSKRIRVYPHYEIDGQVNGRMKCSNISSHSFNPHNMGEQERADLRCPGFGYSFLYFDFKHMEVNTLQWLSQDPKMAEILTSGRDFYEAIWEILTDSSCNSERRQLAKNFFLPVFYGLGVDALAKKLNWPVDVCKGLITRIQKHFPVAWSWMKVQQQSLGLDGAAYDYFGRRRVFDASYKVRNFVVQSPAALVCLHKLVLLMDTPGSLANVCMHIHDGYVLSVKNEDINKTYETTKRLLESENELYPGLHLSVDCKRGTCLNQMVSFCP